MSGDLTLLGKGTPKELKEAWEIIETENAALDGNKETEKVLNISKKIEELTSKYEKLKLCVYYLRRQRDKEIIQIVKNSGYKLSHDNFYNDLDTVERESQSIYIRIKKWESKLPEPKEESETSTFDETVLSYGVITGSGFIDTNAITLGQYYALINVGNNKIKAIEKNGKG